MAKLGVKQQKWSESDKNVLAALHRDEIGIKTICRVFSRTDGSVREAKRRVGLYDSPIESKPVRSQTVTTNVSRQTDEALTQLAWSLGITVSSLIRIALEDMLKEGIITNRALSPFESVRLGVLPLKKDLNHGKSIPQIDRIGDR